MKLREAITKAGNEAEEADFKNGLAWADAFLASLEASGFVIVPKEATEEMKNADAALTPADPIQDVWPEDKR